MEELDGVSGLSDDRRSFLKKLAIGSAFAVPVVSSFTMSNVTAAYAQTAATSANVGAGDVGRTTTTTTVAPNQPAPSTTTTTNPNSTVPAVPAPSDVRIKRDVVAVTW